MKSRVMVKKDSVIAVYGFDSDKLKAFEDTVRKYNIKLRTVSENEKDKTVSEIIRTDGREEMVSDGIHSCMVMSDIDRKTMDRLLDDIRKNKLDIQLKAVVTPYNLKWKFSQLIEELEKEHSNFNRN